MDVLTTKPRTDIKPVNWDFIRKWVISLTLVLLSLHFVLEKFVPFFLKWGLPVGSDLQGLFEPAASALLHGQSPYTVPFFTFPPWALLMYIPFLAIPYPLDIILFTVIALAAFGYTSYKLGARPLTIALLLMLPQLIWGILYGNIDWLVALGFILPPQIGLFFVLLKPQLGIFIAIFWAIEAWRKGGFREVVKIGWPVAVVSFISLIAFPDMIQRMLWYAKPFKGNLSLFPYLIPVGLVMVYRMAKQHSRGLSIMTGPFFTPYIGVNSLCVPILGLLPNQVETIIGIISLWIIWIMRGTV